MSKIDTAPCKFPSATDTKPDPEFVTRFLDQNKALCRDRFSRARSHHSTSFPSPRFTRRTDNCERQ